MDWKAALGLFVIVFAIRFGWGVGTVAGDMLIQCWEKRKWPWMF